MKILFVSTFVVALSIAPAFAGDGQVSKGSLERMGLQSMHALSDAQGHSIRGTSIAIAFSFASVNGVPVAPDIVVHSHFAVAGTAAAGAGSFAGGFAIAIAH